MSCWPTPISIAFSKTAPPGPADTRAVTTYEDRDARGPAWYLNQLMRGVCALVLLTFCSGCATTVHRMDGEFPTSAGTAKTDCEKQDWLVVSPTRAEFVDKQGVHSETRDDGVGLYRIGQSKPLSIPGLSD